MTVTEIKRTLLDAHDRHGFFPREVVESILKEKRPLDVRVSDVVCCMLELVYEERKKEN